MNISPHTYSKLPSPTTKPIAWSDDFRFSYATGQETEENCPIKVGDVVMVAVNNQAKLAVVTERTIHHPAPFEGMWQPAFRGALITNRNVWSKKITQVGRGDIAGGYQIAPSGSTEQITQPSRIPTRIRALGARTFSSRIRREKKPKRSDRK